MSDLLVVIFEDKDDAGKALKSIRQIEREGQISLDDTAVIVKNPDGKVHVQNELDSGVETGAAAGAILGPLLFFAFPVAGIALGAAAGAGLGALFEKGVDKRFVKEISENLKPNNSALFLMIRSGNAGAEVAALEPFKGQVFQTTFPPELEEEFKHALK